MRQEYQDFLYNPIYAYCLGKIINGECFECQNCPLSLENINSFLKWHAFWSLSSKPMEIYKLDSMAGKTNIFGLPDKVKLYSTKG